MSDHYCCKRCGLRYDDCTCPPAKSPPGRFIMGGMPDNDYHEALQKVPGDAFDNGGGSLVEALLDGGFIERYHVRGRRMIVPQNVAEHSWRMAAVLFYINPNARAPVVWATLFHDVSERVTGDLPSPVKNANTEIRKEFNRVSTAEERRLGIRFDLTEEEAKLLRWLDRFEGALHCLDEVEMGNRKAIRTLLRYLEYCTGAEHQLQDTGQEKRRAALFVQLTEKVNNYVGEQR